MTHKRPPTCGPHFFRCNVEAELKGALVESKRLADYWQERADYWRQLYQSTADELEDSYENRTLDGRDGGE